MLVLLSPAKSLDLTSKVPPVAATQPRFLSDATRLAQAAAKLAPRRLQDLMGISDKLAALNAGRFAAFAPPLTPENARPAIYSFAGDVYVGFDAYTLDTGAIAFAQDHVRILSGLYGLLRPLDLMQPYRLEMGVRFATGRAKDLYGFWGDRLGAALAEDLGGHDERTLVNLASQEYFAAVATAELPGGVITPTFKEMKDGKLRFNSFAAKKARGAMARYICERRIGRPEALKAFDADGYRFQPSLSDAATWVFVRG